MHTHSMDLGRLPLDLVEILNKITPNEDEQKKFHQFAKDKKNPKSLPDNDRFLFEVSNGACMVNLSFTRSFLQLAIAVQVPSNFIA